jgi:hypothetical protein
MTMLDFATNDRIYAGKQDDFKKKLSYRKHGTTFKKPSYRKRGTTLKSRLTEKHSNGRGVYQQSGHFHNMNQLPDTVLGLLLNNFKLQISNFKFQIDVSAYVCSICN